MDAHALSYRGDDEANYGTTAFIMAWRATLFWHPLVLWLLLASKSSWVYALNQTQQASSSSGDGTHQLIVRTAQEFVDAVRSLQDGVDTVINIPAGVLINLSEPVTLKPLSVDVIQSGSLTIKGSTEGLSILHLGWRANVSVGAILCGGAAYRGDYNPHMHGAMPSMHGCLPCDASVIVHLALMLGNPAHISCFESIWLV